MNRLVQEGKQGVTRERDGHHDPDGRARIGQQPARKHEQDEDVQRHVHQAQCNIQGITDRDCTDDPISALRLIAHHETYLPSRTHGGPDHHHDSGNCARRISVTRNPEGASDQSRVPLDVLELALVVDVEGVAELKKRHRRDAARDVSVE